MTIRAKVTLTIIAALAAVIAASLGTSLLLAQQDPITMLTVDPRMIALYLLAGAAIATAASKRVILPTCVLVRRWFCGEEWEQAEDAGQDVEWQWPAGRRQAGGLRRDSERVMQAVMHDAIQAAHRQAAERQAERKDPERQAGRKAAERKAAGRRKATGGCPSKAKRPSKAKARRSSKARMRASSSGRLAS
jgi:hypothetical protein